MSTKKLASVLSPTPETRQSLTISFITNYIQIRIFVITNMNKKIFKFLHFWWQDERWGQAGEVYNR